MTLKTLTLTVAVCAGSALTAMSQQTLSATGAFQNWNPLEAVPLSYVEGKYTLEIDFSKGTDFKITTADLSGCTSENVWTVFDTGALTARVTTPGVPAMLSPGTPNIVSPVKVKTAVTVDLESMTITIGDRSMQDKTWSGTLPVLFIDTEGYAPIVSKEDYLKGSYWLDPCGTDAEAFGSAESPLPLQIKGRGNYSWLGFDKKPYRLKLDAKAGLLGMKKSKHFALLAHADDSTGFMRNALGFELSRRLGLAWTPADQPVEVVLNGEYIGLYFLTETIRVDKDRVDITEQPDNSEGDVTGGWLVEIDNYDSDPHVTVTSGDGQPIWFTYKSPEVLSEKQEQYLSDQMTTIDRLICSSDKNDCRWADYVDLTDAARFYIVNEIMDDRESYHGSCYLYRNVGENEKWHFGPVWDFGNSLMHDKTSYIYRNPPFRQVWIGEMCKFPQFMDVVKREWMDFLSTPACDLSGYFADLTGRIATAAAYDHERWPDYGAWNFSAASTEAYGRMLADINWLKEQWGGSSLADVETDGAQPVVAVRSGQLVITVATPCTLPAYTLDGRAVQLTLSAGENTLSLPAGFYIIAGRKIMLYPGLWM